MDAYIYQADLVCERCVHSVLHKEMQNPDESERPSGPYPDGGGESDSPQYCYYCRDFLENPLTSDGVRDLIARFADALGRGRVNGNLIEAIDYYLGSDVTHLAHAANDLTPEESAA